MCNIERMLVQDWRIDSLIHWWLTDRVCQWASKQVRLPTIEQAGELYLKIRRIQGRVVVAQTNEDYMES